MKQLLHFALLAMASLSLTLLAGCPDTKLPQTPPQIPEPKAAVFELPAFYVLAATVSTLEITT